MRVITSKGQAKAYKSITEVLKLLATVEGEEADYCIGDMYAIAGIVGGKQMVKLLHGGMTVKHVTNSAMHKWSKEELIEYIRLLEEWQEAQA